MFLWLFELQWRLLPRFRRLHERAIHGWQIAVAVAEGFSESFHYRCGRYVADEMPRQFGGDEARGTAVPREIAEHRNALLGARLGVGLADHLLRARFMRIRVENEKIVRHPILEAFETKPFERRRNLPARDHARESGDVRLRVPTINAEGVQLQDFSREVLVQTLRFAPDSCARALGSPPAPNSGRCSARCPGTATSKDAVPPPATCRRNDP